MTKGAKIALGIGIPLALGSLYWFVIRKRRPSFYVSKVDWTNKTASVMFGNTLHTLGANGSSAIGAGKTYDNSEWTLMSIGNMNGLLTLKLINKVTPNTPTETIVIDFKSKLMY